MLSICEATSVGQDFAWFGSCCLWTELGASMFGEFFSGVCHKENGENCSAEAVTDGRLKLLKSNSTLGLNGFYFWIQIILDFRVRGTVPMSIRPSIFKGFVLAASSRGDWSHWVINLCNRVVMGLNIFETTGGFQGARIRLLVFLRDEPAAGALGWKVRD